MYAYKGTWSSETTYATNDCVIFENDSRAYRLKKPAPAGAAPGDDMYWAPLSEDLAVVMELLVGALDEVTDAMGEVTDALEDLDERVTALEEAAEDEETNG